MPPSSANGDAVSRDALDEALTLPVAPGNAARDRFRAGDQLATYRVVRFLGSGGMGEVYEAEHLDTHRRVALKILNHTLATAADQARFLREGQLAASINHPNSVYIFATEEIDGALVIVMELASGGTLKDVVEAHGPLTPPAAVDAILQVIDGLEAAGATGVLHRDVKPSNCFVDGDGTVKIGDFGLSIATEAQEQTHLTLAGTLLGTPAFAPPEQIRGGHLDVRSDLYSTGATLYYLLTGQPPFAGHGVVQIVANVLERNADSPKRLRPDLPEALAHVVQRCLAKAPAERPDSYQRLRRDLLPFSSQAPMPAAPGARVMAGIIDVFICGLPIPLLMWWNARMFGSVSPARVAVDFVSGVVYFGLLEGIWSASPGKMLFGLGIAGPGHRPPGMGRIAVRTLVFVSSQYVPLAILLIMRLLAPTVARATTNRDVADATVSLIGYVLVFSTARRGNGFAGLHDLASGTRVVRRLDSPIRERLSTRAHVVQVTTDAPHIGPYALLETREKRDAGQVLLAYDEVLRRRVWIQLRPAGSPAVPSARRDMARPGRLRWLTGKCTPVECWDAYDAPEGLPFVTIPQDRRPWSAVRFWLFDLARELDASVADHREVALDVEHVWMTQSGRAVLLDFRCPGLPSRASTSIGPPSGPDAAQADAFLRRFATMALGREYANSPGRRIQSDATGGPIPLHAHAFLLQLEQRRFPNLKAIAAALYETLGKRAVLTRKRRAVHLALCAVVPACALMAGLAVAVIRGVFTVDGIVAPLAGSLTFLNLAVLSAAYFRGGLMLRALDIAIVTGAGEEATRERTLLRAIVAWSPCMFFLVATLFDRTLLGAAALVLMVGGAVMAFVAPERGLQDRIVGTWLVPR